MQVLALPSSVVSGFSRTAATPSRAAHAGNDVLLACRSARRANAPPDPVSRKRGSGAPNPNPVSPACGAFAHLTLARHASDGPLRRTSGPASAPTASVSVPFPRSECFCENSVRPDFVTCGDAARHQLAVRDRGRANADECRKNAARRDSAWGWGPPRSPNARPRRVFAD